jgi:hypothetical protein
MYEGTMWLKKEISLQSLLQVSPTEIKKYNPSSGLG